MRNGLSAIEEVVLGHMMLRAAEEVRKTLLTTKDAVIETNQVAIEST